MTRTIAALLIAAILAASGWAIHTSGLAAGRAEIQAQWDRQRIADSAAAMRAVIQARAREQALQHAADKIHQEKTREIADLNRRHAALVDSLRHRPDRPADYMPATAQAAGTGPAASCNGSQLYRSDAEFLVWEAARADEVRVHLSECRAAYDSAREVND